jgi:alkylation response protein AidB-like acyl-CoA dehydrogenase
MIDLLPSLDQSAIGAAASEFLSKKFPPERVRELAATTYGPEIGDDIWREYAEMGWFSLGIAPDHGGLGMGVRGEVMLFRELGRHLAPGPFLATVIGLHALVGSGSEFARSLADGSLRAGLKVGSVATNARPGDLVLDLGSSEAKLFQVASVEPVVGVDPTSSFVRIVASELVATISQPGLMDRARVLAAAELTGIVDAVRDMSASYAKTRMQFGRPIGSFQAVKHRCANMAIASYASMSQLFFAAVMVDASHPDAPFHAASAYAIAVNAARVSTADNVQNHGGIGFSRENNSHLYLKRAFLLEHILGPMRGTLDVVMEPARHEFSW